MVRVSVAVAPGGLNPVEARKAWHLRVEEGYTWEDTMDDVRTVTGEKPKLHAVRNAVQRVSEQGNAEFPGHTNYANCGCKPKLTKERVQAAVDVVNTWQHNRTCTWRYIIQELKLPVKCCVFCFTQTMAQNSAQLCGSACSTNTGTSTNTSTDTSATANASANADARSSTSTSSGTNTITNTTTSTGTADNY